MTKPAKPRAPAQRDFTWGIKTSDIAFMRSAADAPLAGCDCGCGAVKLAPARTKRNAARRAGR